MGSPNNIMAQVFKEGTYEAWKHDCNPIPQRPIPMDLEVEGEEWFEPEIRFGVVHNYNNKVFGEESPSANAVQTVRLRDRHTGKVYNILGTQDDWAEKANACCGTLEAMDIVTYPEPVSFDEPCGEVVCTDTVPTYPFYAAYVEPIIAGQKLTMVAKDGDGVAFAGSLSAGGYATIDLLLAAVQSTWGAYGTWTKEGTTGIKLSSTTQKKASLSIKPINQDWCMTIVAAQVYRKVKNGNDTFDLGADNTVVNAAGVIAVIKDFFQDGTLTAFSTTKINYNGPSVPGGILNAAGAAVASFTVGACA